MERNERNYPNPNCAVRRKDQTTYECLVATNDAVNCRYVYCVDLTLYCSNRDRESFVRPDTPQV